MFQDTYKNALSKINLSQKAKITDAEIEKRIEESRQKKRRSLLWHVVRPVLASVFVLCLLFVLALPTAAENIPEFYEVLKRHAPNLVDYLIPIQISDSKEGIIMQLEAAKIEGNTAEIIVSFRDEEGGDNISGMVDMYDSYSLYSYGGDSNVGGCSFLEYNEEQDKAYFKVTLSCREGTFDKTRMKFEVYTLLTDCYNFCEEISMESLLWDCNVKEVSLNGQSGSNVSYPNLDKLSLPGNMYHPNPGHLVLDIPIDQFDPDSMHITGMAYMDGILRVQLFRGTFQDADRHMNLYLKDMQGNTIIPDRSVMWHEEIGEEEVLVDEFYFVITEERLKECTLFGESGVREGSIKGDWSIIFDME